MKENISTGIAVLAIVISIVAIASTVVIGPVSTIGTSAIGENELKDNSVTGDKVADGALTDDDISNIGISKIADNAITSDQIASDSITLLHLGPEVISAMTGETNVTAVIEDDSITSAKIADGTITDDDITDSGISEIADNAITGSQIASNSITLAHLTSAVIDAMTGVTGIANNSITSAKITDGTIVNVDISDSADIAPSKILGTAWTATNDGSGSGLDADKLDGINSDMFLRNDESGTIAGNLIVSGDMTADEITVETIAYSTPRTHYYSVGSEHFHPWNNVDYWNGGGCGGAYLSSGTGGLSAPVNFPHGAIVTSMQVFFSDTSDNDMSVTLTGQYLGSCGYFNMADLDSDDNSGYYSRTDSTITFNPIDNKNNAYYVRAYSTGWNSNLKIKGAVITYTIDEV